jgi:hypothetical protein
MIGNLAAAGHANFTLASYGLGYIFRHSFPRLARP